MLQLTDATTYLGPSPWADEPVVTATLVVAEVGAFESAAAKLAACCSEWFMRPEAPAEDPAVSVGQFVAAWCRDLLNQQDGRIIEAGAARDNAAVVVYLGYHQPRASFQALTLCTRLLDVSAQLDERFTKDLLALFRARTLSAHPDYQAAILIEYARRTSLPWRRREGPGRLWQFGWGARGTVMFESKPMSDSSLGSHWANEKAFSKRIFRELGAPVAASAIVRDEISLEQAAENIGVPCVVKPLRGSRSVGVTTYVRSLEDLRTAFGVAAKTSPAGMTVERHIEGELIRIMVMRGTLWRAIRRNRLSVVADGHSTAAELLAALNQSRPESEAARPGVGPVPHDDEFLAALRDQDLEPNDIPAAGRVVRLRNIPLLAAGARYDDVTDVLHPDTRDMAEALARYFGIQSCGLDFITADPAQSCHRQGAFLEINSTPGLRVPIMAGVPEDEVCRVVLGEDIGRVPSLLVVAAGESRAEIRKRLPADHQLGWASGELAGLGATTLSGRRPTVCASTEVILRHPLTRAAVVIATAEDIRRFGLPADRFDAAIVMPAAGLDDTWTSVVRRRSGTHKKSDDLADLHTAIATLGRA